MNDAIDLANKIALKIKPLPSLSSVKQALVAIQSLLITQNNNTDLYDVFFNLQMYCIEHEVNMEDKINHSYSLLSLLPITFFQKHQNYHSMIEGNIGLFYEKIGNIKAAHYHYNQALNIFSNNFDVINHLGHIYLKHYSLPDIAIKYFEIAKQSTNNDCYADVLNNLLLYYVSQKEYDKALKYGHEYLNIPNISDWKRAGILTNLSSIYISLYDCKNAYACLNQSLTLFPSQTPHTQRIFIMMHCKKYSLLDIRKELEFWVPQVYKFSNKQYNFPHKIPTEKLHIGFMSSDFINHVIGDFIKEIISSRHLSSYFNISCFCTKTSIFEQASALFPLVKWYNIHDTQTSNEVVTYIRSLNVDILIDLNGPTTGNRLDVFALRAAPVQFTYLSYPGSTGVTTIDYRITDKFCDSIETESHYTEKLLYMPNSSIHYTPRIHVDFPPSYDKNRPFTIGYFNKASKLNKDVVSLWKKILNENPLSILLVKILDFSVPSVKEKIIHNYDLSNNRIKIIDATLTYKEHLKTYLNVDIALDPFPYSGTSSTCEALYMGVPVITLIDIKNPSCRQDMTKSILINSNLPEFIATSIDEYLKIIQNLAKLSPLERQNLRIYVRNKFLTGSICSHTEDFIMDFAKLLQTSYTTKIK